RKRLKRSNSGSNRGDADEGKEADDRNKPDTTPNRNENHATPFLIFLSEDGTTKVFSIVRK
ncbi:MAG: hypothetical protein ACJ8KA_08745, partial [Sulfurifustis sp.]